MTSLQVPTGASAMGALRFVHAEAPAASRAGPVCFFFGYKERHSLFLDPGQIIQDVDAVARPVALLEVQQVRAGISGTGEAKPAALGFQLCAVSDGAGKAGLGLVPGAASTTRAGFALPDVGPAQTAVQAAGSYDFRVTDSNPGLGHRLNALD